MMNRQHDREAGALGRLTSRRRRATRLSRAPPKNRPRHEAESNHNRGQQRARQIFRDRGNRGQPRNKRRRRVVHPTRVQGKEGYGERMCVPLMAAAVSKATNIYPTSTRRVAHACMRRKRKNHIMKEKNRSTSKAGTREVEAKSEKKAEQIERRKKNRRSRPSGRETGTHLLVE